MELKKKKKKILLEQEYNFIFIYGYALLQFKLRSVHSLVQCINDHA